MSDLIKHECGVGLIRLFHPLEYYQEKYGSALWGLSKMYLLMEKQRNRGQDGAGLGCVKLNMPPGRPYHARIRETESNPWTQLFKKVNEELTLLEREAPQQVHEANFLKQNFSYAGEVLIGHLRYGTHGSYGVNFCHPVIRTSNYINRCLMLAGNFNMTNVDYLFAKLVELGQHPRHQTDTETVLERIAHFLDTENDALLRKLKKEGFTPNEISHLISDDLNVPRILKQASKAWDGGYVITGIIGNGDAFAMRDPNGIRPCFYYYNDEFAVVASERSPISTIFDLPSDAIHELAPGSVLAIKGDSKKVIQKVLLPAGERKSCSFERIYFSRGNDKDIYKERKDLGRYLVPKVLEQIDYDLERAVFSFIPNTAESSFLGMLKEVERWLNQEKLRQIKELGDNPDPEAMNEILSRRARADKIINKDVKMRTFITDDSARNDLVSHVYDITPGVVRENEDALICIDDSIVRGTTLKRSILSILARLSPRKVIIVSSAPQIRYPDCYGIDMSQIEKLVAFQAAIMLLKESGKSEVIDEVYRQIIEMKQAGIMHEKNAVKAIYKPFTPEEISAKIAEIIKPKDFPCELSMIYQSLEDLHRALPDNPGDWYFSGDYPTIGGNRIVNQAYLNFYEGRNERAYQLSMSL